MKHAQSFLLAAVALATAATGITLTGRVTSTDEPPGQNGGKRLFDGRVIPAMPKLLGVREQYELRVKWLERKHAALLPMMRRHGIGMWVVVNEEFHNDPVTEYVVPPLVYVSRRDVITLVDGGAEGLKVFSNYWRPTADYARFVQPFPVPADARGQQDTREGLRKIFDQYKPKTIGLALGGRRGQDSGLTRDSYQFLLEALGPDAESRVVPAAPLVEEYFDTRLPEELELYRAAVLATDILAQRALSTEVITPGKTRAADIKWFYNDQIARLGVGAEPWFEIHVAVQRFDPAKGDVIPYVHPAPDDLVFQRGDVIHLDCGFNYLGFATDWQKVAYILREGETDVTPGMKQALKNGNITQDAIRTASRPGMTGHEATVAAMQQLKGVSFLPSLYSHPIGYQGHGLGPSINARNGVLGEKPERDSILRLGSYRSIELSATTEVPEWNGKKLLIPFEDDAYLTEKGYEWFRPPQTSWYLIR
jgi:Xaa-Pro aminopeptidase